MSPAESAKVKRICPVCKRQLTIGVLNRVEELADRPEGFVPENAVPFKRLIPLTEIIIAIQGGVLAGKKTWETYNKLLQRFGSEFNILLEADKEDMEKIADEKIADAIIRNRNGEIEVKPGYDGEYGVPVIGEMKEKKTGTKRMPQKGLGEFF